MQFSLFDFDCVPFLQIGFGTGVLLTLILGVSFSSVATLFTKDAEVLAIVRTGVLVSASFLYVDIYVEFEY